MTIQINNLNGDFNLYTSEKNSLSPAATNESQDNPVTENRLKKLFLAGGKKSLRAYLWKVCGDAYDQSNG